MQATSKMQTVFYRSDLIIIVIDIFIHVFLTQDWLRNNDGFTRFILLQESRPECCSLKLASLLITPIQRIPR